MNRFKPYIYCVLILAIVTAGISPACAFISGQGSVIQICAADGSLQSVKVDASFDPFAQQNPDPVEHLEPMEKCPFCFAVSHHQYGQVQTPSTIFNALPRYLIVSSGTSIPLGSTLSVYQPRGPPQLS